MSARLGRVAVWLVGLGAALAALHSLGGALAPPPLTEPGQLGPWLKDREPAEAMMALARLAAIAVAWYLAAATVLATVARLSGHVRMVAVADAVSVGLIRRLVGGGLGLTMAAGSMVGPALANSATVPQADDPVIMRLLPDEPEPEPPSCRTGDTPAGRDRTKCHQFAGGAPAPPEPAVEASAARTWEVQPGQHFWAVAEQVLADAWSRGPDDREIVDYWRSLVEANRSLLADPANADLLFPGQVLTLPAVPPAP